MKFSTDGLIIKEQNIGEQDKLVLVLTKSNGVISAFVRGAKNIKNSKCGSTSLLCYSRLDVYKSRDSYIIDDAKSVEMFIKLRQNVENMSLAQYFCELCIHLCPKDLPADEFLSLVLNSLHLLSTQQKSPMLIKACFEMRLMCMCGYMPNLVMCDECGAYENEQMAFSPKDGNIICGDCLQKENKSGYITLGMGVTTALRHIIYSESGKLFNFNLSPQGLNLLNTATENYIAYMVEKDFPTLQFYKMIKQI